MKLADKIAMPVRESFNCQVCGAQHASKYARKTCTHKGSDNGFSDRRP